MSSPLTDAEKIRIRRFTGWSDRFGDTDEPLVRAFYAVDQLPATLDEIRLLLERANGIELRIYGGEPEGRQPALDRLKAESIGAIVLNETEIQSLQDLGLQASAQIARLLGVEVRGGNPWSTSIPTERAWYGGPRGGGGGGGGIIPFG